MVDLTEKQFEELLQFAMLHYDTKLAIRLKQQALQNSKSKGEICSEIHDQVA